MTKREKQYFEDSIFIENEMRKMEKKRWRQKVDVLASVGGDLMRKQVEVMRETGASDKVIYEVFMDIVRESVNNS